MRRFWLLIPGILFTLQMASTGSLDQAVADDKADPPASEDEPATAEMLGHLRLTIEPGAHTHDVRKVIFTPDGKYLVSGSWDRSIRIWNVASGELLKVLRPPGDQFHMLPVLSPDGKHLAVSASYGMGKQKRHVIQVMSFPEGRIEKVLKGNKGGDLALAFSADGKRLASSGRDKSVRIWKLPAGELEQEYEAVRAVLGLAFSPDGTRLLQSYGMGFWVRDLASKKLTNLKGGHVDRRDWSNDNVAWSGDGKTIATCSADGLRLWDAGGKLRHYLLPKITVYNAAFSKDSNHVVAALYEPDAAEWAKSYIFDVRTGKEETKFAPIGYFQSHSTLSPDGKLAATGTGGANPAIFLWKVADGSVVRQLGSRSWLTSEGLRASWGGPGNKVVSWRPAAAKAKNKSLETSFHLGSLSFWQGRNGMHQMAVVQEGTLSLEAAKDDTVHVMKDGKVLSELKLPPLHRKPRLMTLVGPDRAAVACEDWAFLLYDTKTGKLIRRMPQPCWIMALTPSPDKRFLLSLGGDQTLRIWDARDGNLLLTLFVSGQDWIAWTKRGYYAASPGGEKLMGWTVDQDAEHLATFHPASRFRKQLYRPDVIQRLFDAGIDGDFGKALAAADKARGGKSTTATDASKVVPPRATVAVDTSKLPEVTVKGTGTASAKDQPVIALQLLLNGRPAQIDKGLVRFTPGKSEATAAWTLKLEPGTYSLGVAAQSKTGSAPSEEVAVTVKGKQTATTLHLLVVGVNAYKDKDLTLKFARADAEAVAKVLPVSSSPKPFDTVKATVLLDDKASKQNILDALDTFKKAKASDIVVVFYAGHGIKSDKGGLYVLPVEADTEKLEATCISGELLKKKLGDVPCRALLIMDACHSTAVNKRFKRATDDLTRELTDEDCAVAVLSAAMAHEEAGEKDGHGYFSRALIDGLGGKAACNPDDRCVYLHHLFMHVFDSVQRESGGRQHPFLNLPWTVHSFPIARAIK